MLRVSLVKVSNRWVPTVSQPSTTSQSLLPKVRMTTEGEAAGPQIIKSGAAAPAWLQFKFTMPEAPPKPSTTIWYVVPLIDVKVMLLCTSSPETTSSLLARRERVEEVPPV